MNRIEPHFGEKPERPAKTRADGRLRSAVRRVRSLLTWRRMLGLAIGVAMVPAFGALLYRAEFTHPPSTTMLWRWATLQPVERRWMELADIAPILRYSVIMSEDGQFCTHRGVDWAELNAVIDDMLEGEKARGASTLTMQTARNLFLWNHRSYIRKALEIPLAIYIDLIWPKTRILEVYLNLAEWDEGVFGAQAAAQHYFGRSASQLTARQAALLAATLPNPRARDPARPGNGLNRLAGIIQARAAKSGGYVGCVRQS